jgi:hypothetical protein
VGSELCISARRGEWWGRRDQDESQRARRLGIGLTFVIKNERGCNETQGIKADASGYKGGGSHRGKNIHIYMNVYQVGRTVVVIAHRLSTVRNAAKIVVMGEGGIKVRGEGREAGR